MDEQVAILEVRNVQKSFGENKVLTDVTFSVRKGEVHALIGENGAGKSTLLKILSGAHDMDGGKVILDGRELRIRNAHDARAAGISIIYQELALVPQLDAVENLFLGDLWKDKYGLVDWKGMRARAKEIFASIDLKINTAAPVSTLSISDRQMVEISRALVNNASVIAMDEPTSSLSEKEVDNLFALIGRLKSKGIAVIYVSHRMEELFRIADTVTVLRDGIVSGQFEADKTDKDELVSAMVGRTIENYYPKHAYHPGEVVLKVEDLNWDGFLHDVAFEVHAGEILGVAGLVGAGRSETMHCVFGALPGASKKVFLHGKEVAIHSPESAISHKIGLLPEDRKTQGLLLKQDIRENISFSNLKAVRNKVGLLSLRKETAIAKAYLQKISIKASGIGVKVQTLSGGNQQKVVVAKWLNTDADVYIFDEPTRGVDVGAKVEIYQLMSSLAESGKAVIMVSSELPEILGISDRVMVMREGRVTGFLSRDDMTEEKIMHYATLGE